jgi:kexin
LFYLGIRILSKEISADQEAHAIGYGMQTNEIYSCSWGPPDDGRAMDRPPPVAQAALENAIQKGRGGKGNIYVFASGNGGFQGDDCNYDGYTNSIYSITVGSVDAFHNHPGYSESCTALLVSAYSSGVLSHRIYTSSSWHNQCTDEHGGTSAAAPFVAGVAALALQVRPDLTWRDMQYVSVKAAIPINTKDSSWDRTAVGRWYSPAFGYGKIDAYQFVQTAKAHELVRPQVKINSDVIRVARNIPEGQGGVSSSFVVTRKIVDEAKFGTVEHVTVTLNIQHQSRNNIRVTLKSPSNVVSTIVVPRPYDTSNQGYPDWRVMTVKHWSEDPLGDWTLTVADEMDPFATGIFVDWRVTIYGEQAKTPVEIKPTEPKKDTEDEELKPSKVVEEKETETSKPDSSKTPEEQTESDKKDNETSEDSKKETEKENKEEPKPTEPKEDESKKDESTEKTKPAESSELVVDNSETEEKNDGFSTFTILIFAASGLGFIVLTAVAYRRYKGYSHLPKSQDLEMLDTPNEPHSPYHDDSVEVAFEAGLSDSDNDNDGDNSSFTPLVHSNSGNNFRRNDDLV